MSRTTEPAGNRLIIPAFRGLYDGVQDSAETLLRVVAGGALAWHGLQKVANPFGATEMVETLGFFPGVFWSPLLSFTEFFAGVFLVIGLLTRPAAIAATIILVITIWFHWVTLGQGYDGAEKSILWTPILIYFAARGARRHSVDSALGREF